MLGSYMNQPYMMGGQQPQTGNPYLDRLNQLQSQQMAQAAPPAPRCEIVHVNGENGARAWRMAPNSQCLLLDDTAPIVWLAITDGAGYPTLTPYTITPYQAAPAPDYNSLDDRISKLEAILSAQPNPAANAKNDGGKPGSTGGKKSA